ncbi:MAG: flagellar hook capping FlgD N-terminal domain-containing protein [Eubacteriales bacterium]|nr:flagellar hook capping FlgD N-terminal domain-containing protein [Eubacteriales bacterium]
MAAIDSAVSEIANKANSYISGKSKEEPKNDLDKDAFLQLLVAQMQYQDPLNPGDSTEYMSQLAQYSSLEATMNISSSLEKGNALNLVGQYVIMHTTDSTGNDSMVSGLVEYATVKDGEVLVSINDTYYPAADLDSVVDYDYFLYLQSIANGEAGQKPENAKPEDDNTENVENTEA